jgi:hypothetical protein
MNDKTVLSIVAIMSLTILEACALMQGINGSLFTLVIFGVGGIAGYEFKAMRHARSKPN